MLNFLNKNDNYTNTGYCISDSRFMLCDGIVIY